MRPLHIRRLPPEDSRLFLLIREEGIVAEIGDFERPAVLDSAAFSAAAQLRKAARTLPEDRWAGFQPRSSFTASEPVNAIGNIYGQGIVAALGTILGTRPESENCAWGIYQELSACRPVNLRRPQVCKPARKPFSSRACRTRWGCRRPTQPVTCRDRPRTS